METIKSVLTILGYTTKSSIESIKTAQSISKLENEYLKLLGSPCLESIHTRFPELKLVPAFSSGLKSTLLGIVSELNKPKQQTKNMIQLKLFEKVTKVRFIQTIFEKNIDLA